MDINKILLRLAEVLEGQTVFPQWDTIIHILSVLAAWITIGFLLVERYKDRRPYLQISFELVRSQLTCIVFRNVGKCPLEVSSIKFSEEFVKQLPEKTQERVARLEKSELTIFPNQFCIFPLDVLTSTINNDYAIKEVTIDYKYKKLGKRRNKYYEPTTIDFSQYGTMLVYVSEIDELKGSVDSLIVEAKKIKKLISTTNIDEIYETEAEE